MRPSVVKATSAGANIRAPLGSGLLELNCEGSSSKANVPVSSYALTKRRVESVPATYRRLNLSTVISFGIVLSKINSEAGSSTL